MGIKYLSNKKNTNTNKCASLFWLSLFFLFHFVYAMALHILVELYMDIFFLSLVQSVGFGLDDIQCAINAEPEFYVQFIVHIHSNHNIWNKTKIFCTFMKLFRKEIRASFSLAQYCFIIETTWQFVILKDSYPALQNIFF